jgi:hypothetical protein
MAESIAELVVKLSADTASFAAGMKDSVGILKGFKEIAEGLALAEVGRKLAEMVEHTAEWADKMGKLAQVTGTQVEQFSALTYAAKIADVDVEQLTVGLGRLAKNMNAAADGSGKQAKAFDDLHVAVKNADGTLRESDAVLSDLAERFKSMPDGAQKTALAIEIFGKSGARLIPLLNEGRHGLEQLKEEARQLGVVIDEQTAKKVEEMNDNFKRLKEEAHGAELQFTLGMMPALNNTAQAFLGVNSEANNFRILGDFAGDVINFMAKGFFSLSFAIDMAIVKAQKYFTVIKDVASQLAHGASPYTLIIPDTSGFAVQEQSLWNSLGQQLATLDGQMPALLGGKNKDNNNVQVRHLKEINDNIGYYLDQAGKIIDGFWKKTQTDAERELQALKDKAAMLSAAINDALAHGLLPGQLRDALNVVQKEIQQKTQEIAAIIPNALRDAGLKDQNVRNILDIPSGKVSGQHQVDLKRIQQLHEQISAAMSAERKQEEDLRTEAAVGATSQITLETRLNALRKNSSQQLAGQVAEFQKLAGAINDPKLLSQSKAFNAELDSMRSRVVTLGSAFRQTFANIPTLFEQLGTSIVTGAQTIGQAFKNMAKSIVDDLVRVIMHLIVMRALSGLTSAFAGFGGGGGGRGIGGLGDWAGALGPVTGHHAMGGDFMPGPMLVGESGPEIMVPSFGGSIVPNHKIAGMGGQVIYQIDARGGDAGTAQNIMRALKTVEDRAVARSLKILKEKSKRT